MADAPLDATAALTALALDTQLAEMPETVRLEGIRSLVNIVGCTLGGARHDAVEKTWAALRPFAGAAQASLIGRPERTDALTASLINTLASSVNTFDDTHAEAIVHPSGPVMGAVLAYSELHPVTGAEALAAFIVGVEAICRLSKAVSVQPAKGSIAWSQTGIACGIGAGLAAARLMRLDHETTRVAIGIAAAQASGIRALHGTHCTPMMPANAGQAGLRAAFMAAAGVTSSRIAIEARYGFSECFAETPHLAHITEGLGERWEILGNTYKPYPCGIVIHPLIDAALEIARETRPSPEAIATIEIRANPAAMALCFRRHPKDEFEGQVSLYQWVAAALVRGRAGIPEGTDEAIADPVIVALRDRIEVTTDASVPHDGADMTVTLADGRRLSRSIRNCIGSRGRPMTDAELDAKFTAATEGVLSATQATALLASVRGIERIEDAASLPRAARSA
jgi:2-methylcitrate dehydratase PrpD